MLHRSGVALHYERVALGAASGDSPACTTCIHAAGSFLAVGTTDGKVFLYREHDRRGLQPHYELMCTAQAPELVRSSCTCVQLFPRRNGVALAAGTMRGVVIVFELERVPADSVPKLALKHIVRAHLEVLDQSSVNDDPDSVAGGISCMLWATRGHERTGGGSGHEANNAVQLFSASRSGTVVQTLVVLSCVTRAPQQDQSPSWSKFLSPTRPAGL